MKNAAHRKAKYAILALCAALALVLTLPAGGFAQEESDPVRVGYY